MHKKYNRSTYAIVKELSALRKGRGLSAIKLNDKHMLRDVISRLGNVPASTLTTGQIYTHLLGELAKLDNSRGKEALRNAFGLESSTSLTLSDRRRYLATVLGKHPDTIERYENQAILELSTHLAELSAHASPIQSIRSPYLQQLEGQLAMARKATTFNLKGLLSLGERAEEFVQYLEAFRRPYLDTTIEIILKPSRRGSGWYRMEIHYRFQRQSDFYRIAVVTHNADGESLTKLGLIDEFHKINDTIEPTREVRAIARSSKFILHNPAKRRQKLLRFKPVPPETAKQILQSFEKPPLGACHFFEITVPPEWDTPETVFEYHSTLNLREDLRYAYWYTPGIMYVRKLTFDYSDFPDADRQLFKVLTFLGHISGDEMFTPADRSFTVDLNDWLMPGNGIGLAWEQSKGDSERAE